MKGLFGEKGCNKEGNSNSLEKLPSEICFEMQKSGIPEDLCTFIEKCFHDLQQAKGQKKPLSPNRVQQYMKILKEPLGPNEKSIPHLTVILLALEHLLKSKKGFTMRMNQLAALLLLLFGSNQDLKTRGQLLELATGEGKSCVIAFFAAFQAMLSKKVDIICSSPILARRDELEWKDFYRELGLTCASLPIKNQSDYKETYNSNIVYGTVHDFSADVLKEEFDGKTTRGARGFDSLIVDEVDHLTLDSCLSLTYLSHQALGMHHLTSIFAMIWQMVTNLAPLGQGTNAFIRSPQFVPGFLAYLLKDVNEGDEITEIEIITLMAEQKMISAESVEKALQHLQQVKVDEKDENNNGEIIQGCLKKFQASIMNAIKEMNPDVEPEHNIATIFKKFDLDCSLHMLDEDNQPKLLNAGSASKNHLLIFPNGHVSLFFQDLDSAVQAIQDEIEDKLNNNKIIIPAFLHDFAKHMLPRFIKNAMHVAYQCERGVSYQIAPSSEAGNVEGDKTLHFHDAIIPVDVSSTGILEKNKRYSEGVQQFLEMKHQLSISDVTMTTNFLSNFSFYGRFKEIHGLSGTLGNDFDKQFLRERLGLNCIQVPSHKLSQTKAKGLVVVDQNVEQQWMSVIKEDIQASCKQGQAVLIICR